MRLTRSLAFRTAFTSLGNADFLMLIKVNIICILSMNYYICYALLVHFGVFLGFLTDFEKL